MKKPTNDEQNQKQQLQKIADNILPDNTDVNIRKEILTKIINKYYRTRH